MHYLVIHPDGKTEMLISDHEPDLRTLQNHVGGYIEHIVVSWKGRKVDAYVNEEGKMNELEFNPKATAIWHNTMPFRRDRPYKSLLDDPAEYISIHGDSILGPMVLMDGT